MSEKLFLEYDLTPNEKTIADYISKNGITILNKTEDELAKELQISNATVSRFWRKIGFKNFKEYKNSFQESIMISPANKLENMMKQVDSSSIQAQMIATSIKHLEKTVAEFNEEVFQQAVEAIIKGKTIYVYSPGPSEGLGSLFNFRLTRFGVNIKMLQKSGHEIYETLVHFESNDVLLMFGFVKLHPESQILLTHAKKLGMKAIIVTDCLVTDFSLYADYLLFASRGELWEFHSMIAPTFIVENMIIAVGKKMSEQSMKKLEMLDAIRKEYKDILPR